MIEKMSRQSDKPNLLIKAIVKDSITTDRGRIREKGDTEFKELCPMTTASECTEDYRGVGKQRARGQVAEMTTRLQLCKETVHGTQAAVIKTVSSCSTKVVDRCNFASGQQ